MKGYKYKLYSKPHSANNFNKLIHLYKKISHPKYQQQEGDEKKQKSVIKSQGKLSTHSIIHFLFKVINKNLFKYHYVIGKGGFGRV